MGIENSPSFVTVAVIGTAGRGVDAGRLTPALFDRMYAESVRVVRKLVGDAPFCAVSGAAAWADHLAIMLYERGVAGALRLCLPANLGPEGFHDNGYRGKDSWFRNPGARANELHRAFEKATGIASIAAINALKGKPNVSIDVIHGFHQRNIPVSGSRHCVAFTFGQGALLNDGGTADTVRRFLIRNGGGKSVHVCLPDLAAFSPARVG